MNPIDLLDYHLHNSPWINDYYYFVNNQLNYTIVESIVKIAEILAVKTIAEFV